MSIFRLPPKILVVLGPTASGKSELAVRLAKRFHGEIVSADSRQVYRGLDIGTNKVPRDKLKIKNQRLKLQLKIQSKSYFYKGVRHHLIDVAPPRKPFTVAEYVSLARRAVADILSRGKLPIICGGTGHYIDALLGAQSIPDIPPDPKLRAKLDKLTASELFVMLKKLDPWRARTIDRHNPRRLVRAIEIVLKTGSSSVALAKEGTRSKYSHVFKNMRIRNSEVLKIGIAFSPDVLRSRIRKRLRSDLKRGLITEAKRLHARGLSWARMEELGLEYRYVSRHLRGMITKDAMAAKLETEIWRYAKRQMTWFKRDTDIRWAKGSSEAVVIATKALSRTTL